MTTGGQEGRRWPIPAFELRVRAATVADAPVVAEIYVESSNAAFGSWQGPMELSAGRIRRWVIDLARPDHHWWVAEIGTETAGVSGIGPSREPVEPTVGELHTIAVLPAHWCHGFGRALTDVVNADLDADGYELAVLWTWADYPAAARFYPAVGWTCTDRYPESGRQVCYSRPRHGRAHRLPGASGR